MAGFQQPSQPPPPAPPDQAITAIIPAMESPSTAPSSEAVGGPGLDTLLSSLFGGGEGEKSEFSETLMGFLPQVMGGLGGELELPGILQMLLGMLDAQFSSAPPEYVHTVLLKSREMLDLLIAKYTPGMEKREVGAADVNEDTRH